MQIKANLLQNEHPKNSSIDQIFAEAVETTDNEKEDTPLLQKGAAITPSTTIKRDTRDRTHRNDTFHSITNSKGNTPMLIETGSISPMAEDHTENEVTEPKDTTTLIPAQ